MIAFPLTIRSDNLSVCLSYRCIPAYICTQYFPLTIQSDDLSLSLSVGLGGEPGDTRGKTVHY